jgi:hypothetical protein
MGMTKFVRFVVRGFGYLVVGAVLLGVMAALLGGLAAIVATYVIS